MSDLPTWMPTKGPKTKRLAEDRFRQLMYHSQYDDYQFNLRVLRHEVPEAWHTLEFDIDVTEKKEKVTLYLNKSIIKMFHAMGNGYQARINRVLETWLQMKIAGFVGREREMLQRIDDSMDDYQRPTEPPDNSAQWETLEEHWAYKQGFRDAKLKWAGKGG